jgi:hypothetical protein
LLIQATLPAFRLRILDEHKNAVQHDDTDFIRLTDNLLMQGLTYATLTEEARTIIWRITEGVENNIIRAFVIFVSVGNNLNHMFAVV